MITIDHLWKTFGRQEVLRGASFEVQQGEFVALVGMSGSGKSLLLKHLVRLMAPDRGRVLVEGRDLAGLSRVELESLRSRMGYVFQNGALFDSMTVYENVAFPLREKTRMSETVIREKVLAQLELVGLKNSMEKYPAQLSGGMVKRVALARTLVREPEVILFDEPTTGLDPIVSRSILQLFDEVHKRLKLTGIIVTHEIPEVFHIVEKVAMLHEGRIIAMEPPAQIQASNDPLIDQFIHGKTEGPIRYR
jgi:phospholipid/cholesterol/gamma-HCH transport system ATP-binding protein